MHVILSLYGLIFFFFFWGGGVQGPKSEKHRNRYMPLFYILKHDFGSVVRRISHSLVYKCFMRASWLIGSKGSLDCPKKPSHPCLFGHLRLSFATYWIKACLRVHTHVNPPRAWRASKTRQRRERRVSIYSETVYIHSGHTCSSRFSALLLKLTC